MKHWIVLVLVGLLLAGVTPTYASQTPNQVELTPSSISTAMASNIGDIGSPAGGPRRDPAGQDDIFYDQGDFAGSVYFPYNQQGGLIGRVIFTPVVDFTLQAFKIAVTNPYNIQNVQANIWVYHQDANNNLTDRVLTKRFTVPPGSDWSTIELAENEYVQFDAGTKFSIIYGPMPGGDLNQQGTGPCLIADQSTRTNTSFLNITQNNLPPTAHNTWTPNQLNRDLYVRANGTLAHFIDLRVNQVFNGDPNQIPSGAYHFLPGTPQTFKAEIENLSDAINAAFLDWYVYDSDSNQVFFYEQMVQNIAAQHTAIVQCDSVWTPDTPGRYEVAAVAIADNDANSDNDVAYLDQFVVDPADHPDDWITYTRGAWNTTDNSNNAGLAAVFYHPGGDVQYVLTGYRVTLLAANAAATVPVHIFKYTKADNSLTDEKLDTISAQAQADPQVFEMDLQGDQQLTFGPGQAAFIVAFNTANSNIMVDTRPPAAGSNSFMPTAMWVTWNDTGYAASGNGDYMIDARMSVSDAPLPGKLLRINPDPLNFGDSLAFNDDHTLEAQFIAIGTDSVHVTNIGLGAMQSYISVERVNFWVHSRDTARVVFTFHCGIDTTFDTQIGVASTWQGHPNYLLHVHASTHGGLSVNEGVQPGIPTDYAVSQNYPNPFNPTTTINFGLPVPGNVALAVFDLNGRQVMGTKRANLGAGYHSFTFDATNLPAGVYTYRLTAGKFTSTKKMVLMK